MRGTAILFWLNRVCGVVVLVGLGIHLYVQHFSEPNLHLTFERVIHMLHYQFLFWLDAVILVAALYKALFGIRSVLYDFAALHRVRKLIDFGLLAAGVVLCAIGVDTLNKVSRFLK